MGSADDAVKHIGRECLQRLLGALDAGVVVEAVDATEMLKRARDGGSHLVFVAHVGHDRQQFRAGVRGGQSLLDRREGGDVHVDQRQSGAFLRQP